MTTASAFDPDAYLAQGQGAGPTFDPDAYLTQPSKPTSSAATPSQPFPENPIAGAVQGAFRSAVAGSAGPAIGGWHGILDLLEGKGVDTASADIQASEDAINRALAPKTSAQAAGASAFASPYDPLNYPGEFLGWTGHQLGKAAESLGAPPALSAALQTAPTAAAMLGPLAFRAPYEVPAETDIPTPGAASSGLNSTQSISAAASTPSLSAASPELQQAVRTAAQKTGGAVNQDALARHLEADSLPVPVKLTQGQALQDPVDISLEQNMRGQAPEMAARFNEQNGQLVQNLQAMRDNIGPDVFSTNPIEHGDTLIDAYKAKDAAAQADIRAKYQALTDANGGQLPMDGASFAQAAQAELSKQMKAPFLPGGINSLMQSFADGAPMTFENFENLRTTLAAAGRTAQRSGDGNAGAAVNIVRNQLENMPVDSDVASVKTLADQARSAAKARFDALRADPAYDAAVNDTVTPDRFVQRFVTGPSASRDGVATMQSNLADNPTALQTMGVAALDHLRRSAGIDDMGNGNFSQANFNKQLQQLGPRLPSLVNPETAGQLETLGNVARYTQSQPRGSFVNNSNTLVASAAEHAKNAAELVINAKAGGVPVASWARAALQRRAIGKEAQRRLAPGAGLDQLQTQ